MTRPGATTAGLTVPARGCGRWFRAPRLGAPPAQRRGDAARPSRLPCRLAGPVARGAAVTALQRGVRPPSPPGLPAVPSRRPQRIRQNLCVLSSVRILNAVRRGRWTFQWGRCRSAANPFRQEPPSPPGTPACGLCSLDVTAWPPVAPRQGRGRVRSVCFRSVSGQRAVRCLLPRACGVPEPRVSRLGWRHPAH